MKCKYCKNNIHDPACKRSRKYPAEINIRHCKRCDVTQRYSGEKKYNKLESIEFHRIINEIDYYLKIDVFNCRTTLTSVKHVKYCPDETTYILDAPTIMNVDPSNVLDKIKTILMFS